SLVGEERSTSPDLPTSPTPGGLPPPGGDGLSLAGVAPVREGPPREDHHDGAPASGSRAVDPLPARNALSLEDRVRRLEDVVATIQLSPHAIQSATGGPEPAPNDPPSLADFIASAAQHFPVQTEGVPPADSGIPAGERTQRWLPFELLAEMRAM